MFFTQEDYRKIQEWLLRNSVKDSELEYSALPFSGTELISLVQDGHNTKISVQELIKQFHLIGLTDFINITEDYDKKYISLENAILLIPAKARKTGLVVTFLDTNEKWRMYQFVGINVNQWTTMGHWVDVIKVEYILDGEVTYIKINPDDIATSKDIEIIKI